MGVGAAVGALMSIACVTVGGSHKCMFLHSCVTWYRFIRACSISLLAPGCQNTSAFTLHSECHLNTWIWERSVSWRMNRITRWTAWFYPSFEVCGDYFRIEYLESGESTLLQNVSTSIQRYTRVYRNINTLHIVQLGEPGRFNMVDWRLTTRHVHNMKCVNLLKKIRQSALDWISLSSFGNSSELVISWELAAFFPLHN